MSRQAAVLQSHENEQLSARNFQRLSTFIQDYSGIKMPANKRTMLEGRLRRRMRATRINDVNAYCRYLFEENGLDGEAIHLIDAVTTNKTEFFREPAHFDFLAAKGLPALAAKGKREIKIWSSACSTGAEPYTIAMVLDEFCEKHRNVDYSILCTDICTEVLDQAVAGRFSEQMIEPVSMARRQRYLMRARDATRNEVRIKPQLRGKLSFARLNLMDEAYPIETDLDIIFCRNILIYFDKATQAKVLTRLCDHLSPGGYLLLGHSESIVGIDLPVVQIANTVFQKR
ncbi:MULTISPECIES: protein-glutamate O-methyltransferase CheR [unclassified Caulobacter]|uniref:CheR family methyltransferase n=1 Tax=unclassified Caulobacter TaxID=2648921 RepID=UPI0006FCD411|nr:MULTISPECIES: CheR family methyltransferase [unclassified Caulobacter]KQV62376.1 chemotaxis protein CheR [Caulobacter sp. Root342]KQV65616.1 chemotaxis protein CheR [Caulobacter sp. Root343]